MREEKMELPTNILTDNRLTLSDIGLLSVVLLLNSPYISEEQIAGLTKNSRTSIRTSIKHLMEYGYMTRFQDRDYRGKLSSCVWTINLLPNKYELKKIEK